jgi:two-component system response regulator YesN
VIDWNVLGYEVVGLAENGEEGLEQAIAKRPDVIMTDIRMPIMDGLKISRRFAKKGWTAKLLF